MNRAGPFTAPRTKAEPPITAVALPWRWRYLRDGVGTLLGAVGIDSATAAARLAAGAIFSLGPPVRRRIESNLRQAYDASLSPAACEALARRVFENVASFWVELLYCRRCLTPNTWPRFIRVPDMPGWQDVARQPGPLLLVTGYLGNPAIAACVLSDIVPPLHVLVDPASQILIEASRGVANRFGGLRLVPLAEAARRVPQVMRSGGRLLLLAGPRRGGRGGVAGTFLGRRARHHATIARLARRHAAEIVVFTCCRTHPPPFRFELAIIDRIRARGPQATASTITQRYLDALDRACRQCPEQFLWTRA